MDQNKRKIILSAIACLGLYLLTTGISYALFSYMNVGSSSSTAVLPPTPEGSKFRVDLTKPKNQECPLNGAYFTQEEKDIYAKRRPLGVMIENHLDSRPQSGLSRADVVYEAVAEGGITRFLAIYYCGASALDVQIGPVRSARTYFVDFISEYADFPLYAHVGGANTPGKANALGQIGDYGWLKKGNDLNQFAIGFPTFWRDTERLGRPVATEHTMYSTTDKLYAVAEKRSLTNVDSTGLAWDKTFKKWQFKDDASENDRGSMSPSFPFWSGYSDYSVVWEYDKTNNLYKRKNGNVVSQDRNDDSNLLAKVIVVAQMTESRANDGYENNLHLLYGDKGSGKAIVFQDGQAIEGTWNKKDRKDRMIFMDAKGKEIKLNRGQIWIEIVPAGTQISY
jgi:hypothetical protein